MLEKVEVAMGWTHENNVWQMNARNTEMVSERM
jgi:hypothetical protein